MTATQAGSAPPIESAPTTNSSPPAEETSQNGPASGTTMKVAIAVLILYIGFVIVLIVMRNDSHWDRLVYLLGGFEAIVFAAIGWIFGTTVARGAVEEAKSAKAEAQGHATVARAEAERERAAARQARSERDESVKDAERGRALAASIKAKRAPSSRLGARPGDADPSPELAELDAFVNELFPG